MNGPDLALLFQESSFHSWESVSSALKSWQNKPLTGHAAWLIQHLLETKRHYWELIAEVADISDGSPASLDKLLHWEVKAAAQLSEKDLVLPLTYGDESFTVVSLLRLNIRHSTWHAGQLAALAAAHHG